MAENELTMASVRALGVVVAVIVAVRGSAAVAAEEPFWAYGFNGPPSTPAAKAPQAAVPPDAKTLLHVDGSPLSFTRAQVTSYFEPADWFPAEHPPMPNVVAHGKKTATPPVIACALCHLPNGSGRPENANVTGLTYEYIVQQLQDFRKGARQSSDPRKTNTGLMAGFAKNMTDEEIKAAATYFASIAPKPSVRVLESETAPRTRPSGGLFIPIKGEGAATEPLGDRIIEVPEDEEQTETRRNPHVRFVAYVPKGARARGEILVRTGNGKVTPCTACHGADLRGLGPVPRLAGLSPSYIARQLYDMRSGQRKGLWAPLMTPVVTNLNAADALAAAAYLASLQP
jgi:cytochrome c553